MALTVEQARWVIEQGRGVLLVATRPATTELCLVSPTWTSTMEGGVMRITTDEAGTYLTDENPSLRLTDGYHYHLDWLDFEPSQVTPWSVNWLEPF